MRTLPPITPTILLLAAALATVPTAQVSAQSGTRSERSDSMRIVDRVTPSEADLMIVTVAGDAALALVGDELLLQLTDQGLELRGDSGDDAEGDDKEGEEQSLMGEIFEAMARAGMQRLLDHGMAYPVHRIRYAEWEDDRLLIERMDGEELFDITVNDRDVMADFRPADARRMVRAIRETVGEKPRGGRR